MSSALCDRSAAGLQQPPEQEKQAATSSAGSSAAYRDITVTLHNVVSCFSTKCHLNLKKIALEAIDVEYKPENYMVTMRLRKPYCVASIRSSGKIFVAGSASEADSRCGARRIARRIQKLGFPCRFANFRITNVHATCELPFLVRLPSVADELPQIAEYEPEIHPALNLRFKDIGILAKVFATGSVVLTGPSTSSIDEAVGRLYPICWRHKSTNKSEVERRDYVASFRGGGGGARSAAGPLARPSPASGATVIGRPSAKRRRVAASGGVSGASTGSSGASASSSGGIGRLSAAKRRQLQQQQKRQQSDDVLANSNLGEEDQGVVRLLLADGKPPKRKRAGRKTGAAASSLLSDLEDNDDFDSMSDSSSSEDNF